MMGCGKSTIGQQLSTNLNLNYIDLDKEIEKHEKTNIPFIFQEKGEPYFRKIESEILFQQEKKENYIMATGGGIILDKNNQIFLKQQNATIIFLKTSLQELIKRTKNKNNRPLLNKSNQEKEIETHLNIRTPIYKKLANIMMDTSHQTIFQTITCIQNKLEKSNN